MPKTIFTIGHSTHSTDVFLDLLKQHDITAVCDVRSSPYSQYNPQYNRENLKTDLSKNGIKYVFLGDELGARSDNPSCYKDGKVQYDILAKTDTFRNGIERVSKGSDEYNVTLMCAEKDPIECHRTILVSRELENRGFNISHIQSDGKIETHHESIDRLRKLLKLDHGDFFMTDDEARNKAYRIQGDSIAYVRKDEKADTNQSQKATQ